MNVKKRYNQHRRDLTIDLECESCGYKDNGRNAYDDRNFWDNVVPNIKCPECKKNSLDIGSSNEFIQTRYPEGFQV